MALKKIVLVEDNKVERRNVETILSTMDDCELVQSFPNGLEAWEYLKENNVDIVITDMQMPKMSGMELIKEIRRINLNAEIIIISGYNDFEMARKVVGLDVVEFVMKPVLDDEFSQAVYKAMQKCDEKNRKISQYQRLMEQVSSSKELMLRQFISSLALDSQLGEDTVTKNEEFFGIDISSGYKVTVIFRIDLKETKDAFLKTYSLIDYITKKDYQELKFYPFSVNENEIAIIAVSNNRDCIVPEIINLKNEIVRILSVQLCGVMSTATKNVTDIHQQYKECRNVLSNEREFNNLVLMCDDCDFESETEDLFLSLHKLLSNFILEKNYDRVHEFIANTMDEYCKNWLVSERNFSYCYVNALEVILSEYGKRFDDLVSTDEIWRKLANYNSIVDVFAILENLTRCVLEIVYSQNVIDESVVKKIKDIIESRYAEHITIDMIAREINFSKRHTQRLFTQITGKTIREYIKEYRISIAKKMLLDNKSIDDILNAVGYKDKTYFTEIFYEQEGMLPKDYIKYKSVE